MDGNELIIRIKPLNDRRKPHEFLTEKGKGVYQQAREHIEIGDQIIEPHLSSEKLAELMILLEQLTAIGDINGEGINE